MKYYKTRFHLLGMLKLRPNNPKICFKNAILIQNENGRDLLIYSDHATQFQLPLNKMSCLVTTDHQIFAKFDS